ncbi:MAG: lactate utilization protein [Clostridia bacterium]|nr:lactate utilization protein [Clostridia bacterium]
MDQLKTALEKRGYEVEMAATKVQAAQMLLDELQGEKSIGIGGSVSIQQLDVVQKLKAGGAKVFWHWLPAEPGVDARKEAASADVYLASANAVTEDGELLFIDGTGNRTAAVVYGPKRVVLVIGRNKLVKDEAEGYLRIREKACPPNAKRLGLQTPCALTGKCTDCASTQRMCNVFLTLRRRPGGHPVKILLVDEDMGY